MRARQVRVMTAGRAQRWPRPEWMLIVKSAEPLTPQKQPAGPSGDPKRPLTPAPLYTDARE